MKMIHLIRHAKSDWSNPELEDKDRPLSIRGEDNAKSLRKVLNKRNFLSDFAYISDSVRTQQTFQILSSKSPICKNHKIVSELYESDFSEYMECIFGTEESCQSILFIGHNPGMESLANRLMGNDSGSSHFFKFPTSCFCSIAFDSDNWDSVLSFRNGKIQFYWIPYRGDKE